MLLTAKIDDKTLYASSHAIFIDLGGTPIPELVGVLIPPMSKTNGLYEPLNIGTTTLLLHGEVFVLNFSAITMYINVDGSVAGAHYHPFHAKSAFTDENNGNVFLVGDSQYELADHVHEINGSVEEVHPLGGHNVAIVVKSNADIYSVIVVNIKRGEIGQFDLGKQRPWQMCVTTSNQLYVIYKNREPSAHNLL